MRMDKSFEIFAAAFLATIRLVFSRNLFAIAVLRYGCTLP